MGRQLSLVGLAGLFAFTTLTCQPQRSLRTSAPYAPAAPAVSVASTGPNAVDVAPPLACDRCEQLAQTMNAPGANSTQLAEQGLRFCPFDARFRIALARAEVERGENAVDENLTVALGCTSDRKLQSEAWWVRGCSEEVQAQQARGPKQRLALERARAAFAVAHRLFPSERTQAKLQGKSSCPVAFYLPDASEKLTVAKNWRDLNAQLSRIVATPRPGSEAAAKRYACRYQQMGGGDPYEGEDQCKGKPPWGVEKFYMHFGWQQFALLPFGNGQIAYEEYQTSGGCRGGGHIHLEKTSQVITKDSSELTVISREDEWDLGDDATWAYIRKHVPFTEETRDEKWEKIVPYLNLVRCSNESSEYACAATGTPVSGGYAWTGCFEKEGTNAERTYFRESTRRAMLVVELNDLVGKVDVTFAPSWRTAHLQASAPRETQKAAAKTGPTDVWCDETIELN